MLIQYVLFFQPIAANFGFLDPLFLKPSYQNRYLLLNLQPNFIVAMKTAEIHTKKGVLKIRFFEEDAPNTVKNFIDLAEKGFYNGLIFHRVIPNFMIQGGCPNGIGNGGPGYHINCELTGQNQYHDRGVLSMAHAGRNTGGSQFFICHTRDTTKHLDRNHTVFGKVYEGLEVIDAIRQGDVMDKVVIKDVE